MLELTVTFFTEPDSNSLAVMRYSNVTNYVVRIQEFSNLTIVLSKVQVVPQAYHCDVEAKEPDSCIFI